MHCDNIDKQMLKNNCRIASWNANGNSRPRRVFARARGLVFIVTNHARLFSHGNLRGVKNVQIFAHFR